MASGESLLFDRSSFQLFKSPATPASEGTAAGNSQDFLLCDMPPDVQTALMRRLHFVLGDGHLQGMHAAVEAKIKDRVATSDIFARLRRELVANGSLPSVSAWQGQLPSLPPQSWLLPLFSIPRGPVCVSFAIVLVFLLAVVLLILRVQLPPL